MDAPREQQPAVAPAAAAAAPTDPVKPAPVAAPGAGADAGGPPEASTAGESNAFADAEDTRRSRARRWFALAVCLGAAALAVAAPWLARGARQLRGGASRFAVAEQSGARIPVGGAVRLYFIGGSNVAWQTWPDQLHMYLRDLGFAVPDENYSQPNLHFASDVAPRCDDEAEFDSLRTPRVAHPAWGSWSFAFDSEDDCAAAPFRGQAPGDYPFRTIAGHAVSCLSGWGCKPFAPEAQDRVRPAAVAQDARHADVVLLSNWVNDFKQQFCGYRCFNGTQLDPMAIADITVANLRRMIRAVHGVNPTALVLVLALYPDAKGPRVVPETLANITAINAKVARGVEEEPDTAFVNFALPEGIDIYQTAKAGHPNCRGDRIMATSVLTTLFDHKVLARSLALPQGVEAETCRVEADCGSITERRCCQAAASCRVSPAGQCVPYGPGAQK